MQSNKDKDTEPRKSVLAGISLIDEKLPSHGFRSGSLVVLGSRPGVGKSALAQNIALSAASGGSQVLYCSLELSSSMVAGRLESIAPDIPGSHTGDALGRRVLIHDRAALTAGEIEALLPDGAMEPGPRLIIIDYLQLMRKAIAAERGEARRAVLGGLAQELWVES